VSDLNRRSPD